MVFTRESVTAPWQVAFDAGAGPGPDSPGAGPAGRRQRRSREARAAAPLFPGMLVLVTLAALVISGFALVVAALRPA